MNFGSYNQFKQFKEPASVPESQFTPISWQLDPQDHQYGQGTTELILAERQVPVDVVVDTSVRPKVLDRCGMTCTFCHNEGTPVAADNRDSKPFISLGSLVNTAVRDSRGDRQTAFDTAGPSGRVSVYADKNGVNFVPGKMVPDESFRSALRVLRDELYLDEMHMTGGEPTLYGEGLPDLVRVTREEGFTVKMTSNGENGARVIPECASEGLAKVNFSIFGTTPEELAEVQHTKYRNPNLAAAKIRALHRSIDAAVQSGVEVGANIVMVDPSHGDRIRRVIDEFSPHLSLRILNDLGVGHEEDSHYMVYNFLAGIGAVPVQTTVTAGSSNARTKYVLPNGRNIYFKQIRPARLPETCGGCSLNNGVDCKEGFYGTRLYVDTEGQYKVGVCLQRMDLTVPVEDFAGSSLVREVRELREREMSELTDFYRDHNSAVQS